MDNDCDNASDLSDFDDLTFDDRLNDEWEKKRKDRIDCLRENVIHTIAVRRYNYVRLRIKFDFLVV